MATATATQAPAAPDEEYVYFHSGSQATYRKVSTQATLKGDFTSIPEIDLSDIDSPSLGARKKIAEEIYRACSVSGFFYLKNHGIPEEVLTRTFEVMQKFFALDHETKMDAHVQKNPAIRGYEPMLETRNDPRTRGDFKEAFTMGDCVIEPEQDYRGRVGSDPPPYITKPQNIWPSRAPFLREGLYEYYSCIFPLAMKLVHIFALAFDLEETALDDMFRFPITGMRALHYPPVALDDTMDTIGLGAHTDFSCECSPFRGSDLRGSGTFGVCCEDLELNTLKCGALCGGSEVASKGCPNFLQKMVLQDSVPALEILNKDGVWVQAPPKPNTFVCNVGQYLERQTNGKFVATVHRVRNQTGQRRYSLPFFLTMDPDAKLQVLDRFVEAESEWKYDLLYG